MKIVINSVTEGLNLWADEDMLLTQLLDDYDVKTFLERLSEAFPNNLVKDGFYGYNYDIPRDDPKLIEFVENHVIPEVIDPSDKWPECDVGGPSLSRVLRVINLPDDTTDWRVMVDQWYPYPEHILYVQGGKMHEAFWK